MPYPYPLTRDAVDALKRAVSACLRPHGFGSSHLTEAIAAAMDFNTAIAMQNFAARADAKGRDFRMLSDERFLGRLTRFGYSQEQLAAASGLLERLFAPDGDVAPAALPYRERCLNQLTPSSSKLFSDPELLAWRNLMVLAINEALKRGVITLENGERGGAGFFVFAPPPGIGRYAWVWMRDTGYGELAVRVDLDMGRSQRTPDLVTRPSPFTTDLDLKKTGARASVFGWLERSAGKWLRRTTPGGKAFQDKDVVRALTLGLEVKPQGYFDRPMLNWDMRDADARRA